MTLGSGLKWTLVAALAIAGTHYGRAYFNRNQQPKYPPNAFHQVKRADMLISVTEDGALRALQETVVRSSLEGLNRIIGLVPEGAHVKKGELLVELDSSGLRDRLSEQELTYQDRLFQMLQATENLKIRKSLAESQIKEGEVAILNAEDDLEKYRDGDAPLLIKTIEARSGILAEQVRIASERYARTQDLVKSGNATKSELEADALSLKREQLALGQYQEDLRLVKKFDQPNQVRLLQSKVEQAKAELDRLKQRSSNEISQAEADLKTSQRSIQFLEESLKTQKRRIENAKIFAPQDGLVVYAPISPFQTFGGGGGGGGGRDEGRARGGRGPGGGGGGGGGGDGTSGEFRGGARRGGRSEASNSSARGSTSSGSSAVGAANQRIASAISGASAAQPSEGGGGSSGQSSGGRSSGGGAGGGSGQSGASAASSFASFPSMRPASTIPAKSANSAATGSGGTSSSSPSSEQSSAGGGGSMASQFPMRSGMQNFNSMEIYNSSPGVLEEGTMVRQRQELIRLPDVSKMLAEINIHESRVRQVRPGMTAYVRIENIPDRKFKGTVRKVALLPDAQMSWMNPDLKVYPTDLLIDEELPSLKPGVSARAEIIITNLTKVLSVPIQTVARLQGENVCFVKKGKTVAPVPVTTGMFNDRFVEITSGLKEGDLVLLAAVGDETIEDTPTVDTNAVEVAKPEAAVEERQPTERPRGNRQGRRPRNSEEAQE